MFTAVDMLLRKMICYDSHLAWLRFVSFFSDRNVIACAQKLPDGIHNLVVGG